jgi:ATP-dependent RNA circularization protein (DNA/RNA ligase family)
MIEHYPKLETLYNRNEVYQVDPTKVRRLEFTNIKQWHITEKIDGTNIRVGLHKDGSIEFGGKTDDAQIPGPLMRFLAEHLTPERMQAAFSQDPVTKLWPEVVVFGEGYGRGIGKYGKLYRGTDEVSFIIFDVVVDGWWLSRVNVADVSRKLGFEFTVPEVRIISYLPTSEANLDEILGNVGMSTLARLFGQQMRAEGIVARTDPLLFYREGDPPQWKPLMWKLKYKDFKPGKKQKPPRDMAAVEEVI